MRADGTWTVLVINNDADAKAALLQCLEEDYRVLIAPSARDALKILESEEVDLMLCEQRLPVLNAVELFRQSRITHPECIRILITGCSDHQELVRCINEAAVYQVVPQPWQRDHLLLLIRRALESRELARRHRYLSRELKFADTVLRQQNDHMSRLLQESYEFDKLVFASDSMLGVCNLARKAASTDLPVLIQGETGTGKELMARAVHAGEATAAALNGKGTLKDKVESLEMHLVSQTLLKNKWNHSRSARELGISRVGLANKIKRYKLDQ